MRKLVKKYYYGDSISSSVANPQTGYIGAALPYAWSTSTNVNSGIGTIMGWGGMTAGNIGYGNSATPMGLGILYAGGILGNAIGGETGNIIGSVAGNLGSHIVKAGSLSGGIKNFADLDLLHSHNLKTFGTKDFKGFGNMGNLAIGIGAGILDRSAKHQRTSGKYGSLASGIDMMGGLVGTLGKTYSGYGGLGSLGMAISNKITGGTDGMTIADSLLGSSSLAGGLTAINPILGAAYVGLSTLNSATGKTTTENAYKDFMSRELLDPLWASYSKSYGDHKNALKYGGKKYGGLSRLTGLYGKADRKVRNDNSRLDTMMDIADRRELGQIRGEQMADINALDYRLNTFGGYDQYGTRIGRKGMKLPTKKEILKIKSILEYKKGGQMNVIPEGALHARKNHMEGAGKDYTHKGIPVMDKDGEQQAEIERDEIIFSLEVTQKLERLKNDGSDEAAIKAGKLLVDEIFHNTDDRTGLITEIINENKIKTPLHKHGGIIAEKPLYSIEAEEPEIDDSNEVVSFKEGGNSSNVYVLKNVPKVEYNSSPLNNSELDEYILALALTPTLEEFFNLERGNVMEAATKNALTRYLPYMKITPNCIATALDNYSAFGVPMVYNNHIFAQDPEKYGFKKVEFDDYKLLPFGALLQDKNNESNPNLESHMVTFVGFDKKGTPMFSYSDGGADAESMHRFVHYPFIKRGNAYVFIGTPEWIKSKTEEYYKKYPKKRFSDGGVLEEGDNAIIAEEPEVYEVELFQEGGGFKLPAHLKYNKELDEYESDYWSDDPEIDINWWKSLKKDKSKEAKELRKKYKMIIDPEGNKIKYRNKKTLYEEWVQDFQNALAKAKPGAPSPMDPDTAIINGQTMKFTGEYTDDGKMLYTPDGHNLYTEYKQGGTIEQLTIYPQINYKN